MECLKNQVPRQPSDHSIVNLDSNAQRYAGKRFGYALLDLDGTFIWADENSQKLFEMRHDEMCKSSIFNLMIPHSKVYLKQKFGENLFSKNDCYGESIAFFYVIYSRNSANKMVKLSRKLKHRQPRMKKEFENSYSKDQDNDMYYTYLKTLSSKCTMIALTFTKKDIVEARTKYGQNVSI